MIGSGTRMTRLFAVAALSAVALSALAACSSSSNNSTTNTTAAPGTTASPGTTGTGNGSDPNLTYAFDKAAQQQLQTVGCYSGAIDGIFGPQTDAAILAFQQAKGLETDGELGPETETALTQAASSGQKVCVASSTTTGASTTASSTPSGAHCTAASLALAFPNTGPVTGYVCAGNYAAVTVASTKYLVTRGSSGWTNATPSTQVCGGASAGYPPAILDYLCASGPPPTLPSTTASTGGSTTTTAAPTTTKAG